jgi:hypothetical protein
MWHGEKKIAKGAGRENRERLDNNMSHGETTHQAKDKNGISLPVNVSICVS